MILYRHIRLDSNMPFYIGIGKTEKRAYSKSCRNNQWHNIVNKHGYRVDIMLDDLSSEEVNKKEIEFISLYGRNKDGGILCNIAAGGNLIAGSDNPMYDKGVTVCIKDKTYPSIKTASRDLGLHEKTVRYRLRSPRFMDYNVTGVTKEFVAKVNCMFGRKHTEESKRKMSESKKGKPQNIDKQKALMSRKNRVELKVFNDLESIEFVSISTAAIFLGVTSSSVSNALKLGRRCKGYSLSKL